MSSLHADAGSSAGCAQYHLVSLLDRLFGAEIELAHRLAKHAHLAADDASSVCGIAQGVVNTAKLAGIAASIPFEDHLVCMPLHRLHWWE